jgi:hypothetical protein
MIRNAVLGAALAVTCGLASLPASATTQVGVLECRISPGVGWIITSSKGLNCLFRSNRGFTEHYVGTLRKFGFDIGATGGGQMVWGVFAPSNSRRGALAGEYVGASADASLGAGIGANALIGGFGRSVSLQPLSIQAQTGVNLALGVTGLELLFAPR